MYLIIKWDYVLSVWFSKSRDQVIPGTAFLFLNKVVFIYASLIIILMSKFNEIIGTEFWVFLVMFGALTIFYGFQKVTVKYVNGLNLHKKYAQLSRSQVHISRAIALVNMLISFSLIFIIMGAV